jgi:nitrogen regulatory protein PII
MESELLNIVVAYIQPFRLEAVVDALRALPGFPGMSVSESRGFGRHGAHPPRPGERSEVEAFEPAVRIEIACCGSDLSRILETIRETAHTGHAGDGKIFIGTLAWAIGIRTGEEGPAAIRGGSGAARGT